MARGQKQMSARDRLEKKLQDKQQAELEAIQAKQKEEAEEYKSEGNTLFAAGKFAEAIECFSEAIELDPKNHVLYSNRSAASLKLLRSRDAVKDAEMCTGIKPDWSKGWSRLGAAHLADYNPVGSVVAFKKGLKLDSESAVLLEGLAAAEKAAEAEAEKKEKEAEAKAAEDMADEAEATRKAEPVIGIDLGTTYSCVAYWGPEGVEILKDEDGSRTVPSYVSWTAAGERVVGHRAKAGAAKNVERTIYDVKRIIGQRTSDEAVQKERKRYPFAILEGDDKKPLIEVETKPGRKQKFAPEEISAMVLGKMKSIAEKSIGRPVKKAVVTVPAYFNDAQRQATKNAGAIAGLEVLRIINEPTAAALAYGLDQKDDSASNVLIFDLGGGTFDATVLHMEEGVFQVLATGGDTRLGGEDFDNHFVDWLVTEFKNKKSLNITEARDLRKLRAAAERAKREMSTSATVKVEVTIDGEEYMLDVKREKFEALNMSLFNKTMETIKNVLKDAELETSEIDEIVLVGGSTRVLKIQEMLSELFGGRQLCRSINPDEAVAYGAAVQGAILSGVRHSACQDIVLVDVTPLSLGIELEGKQMSAIIPRNSAVPCTKRRTYTTEADYEEYCDVRIFEGERPSVKDNHLLGEFKIAGIERAKKGEPQIEVTFALDSNGILNVTARDKKTNSVAECVVANACKGLSPEEIERMVMEAEKFAKEDAELVRKVELKSEIESMAFDVSDKHLSEETLDWLQDLDVANCPLATLEMRHKELSRLV